MEKEAISRPQVGTRVSIITKAQIRYIGTVSKYSEKGIELINVEIMGTEDRVIGKGAVNPMANHYPMIMFQENTLISITPVIQSQSMFPGQGMVQMAEGMDLSNVGMLSDMENPLVIGQRLPMNNMNQFNELNALEAANGNNIANDSGSNSNNNNNNNNNDDIAGRQAGYVGGYPGGQTMVPFDMVMPSMSQYQINGIPMQLNPQQQQFMFQIAMQQYAQAQSSPDNPNPMWAIPNPMMINPALIQQQQQQQQAMMNQMGQMGAAVPDASVGNGDKQAGPEGSRPMNPNTDGERQREDHSPMGSSQSAANASAFFSGFNKDLQQSQQRYSGETRSARPAGFTRGDRQSRGGRQGGTGDPRKQAPRREIKGSDIVYEAEPSAASKGMGGGDLEFNRNDTNRKSIPFPGLDSSAPLLMGQGDRDSQDRRRDTGSESRGETWTKTEMEIDAETGAAMGMANGLANSTGGGRKEDRGPQVQIQPQFFIPHDTEDLRKKAFEQLRTFDPHADDPKRTWDGSDGFFDDLETWSEPSQAWNSRRNWHK